MIEGRGWVSDIWKMTLKVDNDNNNNNNNNNACSHVCVLAITQSIN